MSYKIKRNTETKELFQQMLKEHFEDNLTYEELSKKYNVTSSYVYALFKIYKTDISASNRLSKYDYYCYTGEINNIVQKYLNGISTVKLGEEYKVSDHTVASWLRKQKVDIREAGKVSKINQNIFENIDNEIKAYTLGLIMSDGNITKAPYNTCSITLTQDDGYILEDINEQLLGGLGNILITHKQDPKPRMVLQFNGKKIKEDLAKYNIVPAKSHLLSELPTNIPEELYHHFIRGLYDGDGVCSFYTLHKKKKVRIGYCAANENFTKSYRDFLVNKIGLRKNKLFNTGNCWQCSWASFADLQAFFNYVYQDAHIFLGRKYKKLKDFLNN